MKLTKLPLDFRRASNFGRTLLSRAGLDPSYRKVFAIGFNKTGTSSISALCEKVGLCAVHSTSWNAKGAWKELWFNQAFADGSPSGFKQLDSRFPNSLFLLNVRNLDEWLDSRIEHLRHQNGKGMVFENPNWTISDEATCNWTVQRNAHHLAVLKHFATRPQDLMVLNYVRDPDAAARLAAFLGRPAPNGKPHRYPTAVRREHGTLRNAEMISRCLTSLGIPEDEWKLDLYCPSLEPAETRKHWPADTSLLPEYSFRNQA